MSAAPVLKPYPHRHLTTDTCSTCDQQLPAERLNAIVGWVLVAELTSYWRTEYQDIECVAGGTMGDAWSRAEIIQPPVGTTRMLIQAVLRCGCRSPIGAVRRQQSAWRG